MFSIPNIKCACGAYATLNMTHCAVCGKFLDKKKAGDTESGTGDSALTVPTAYTIVDHKRLKRSQVLQNFRRGLFILAFLTVIINIFTIWGNWNIQNWWSFYAVTAVVLAELSIFYPIGKKQYYWKEVFVQLISLLAYILFIDWYSDMTVSWSLSFVYPIIFAVLTLTISLFTSIRIRSDPGNSLLVLLTIFLFSIGLFLFGILLFPRLLGTDYILLPTFIAFAISLFSFVFFATYRFRDFVRALFKRFHI